MPKLVHNPYKAMKGRRKRLSLWQLHTLWCTAVAFFETYTRVGRVDARNAARALPALRKAKKQAWGDVLNTCVECGKTMRPGSGTTVKGGWRIHRGSCLRRHENG